MNHLRLDARQRGDLMGDRIVELASVNAPPTSRASITSGSSELIFAEASLSRHDESGLGQGMVATNSVLPKHVSAHLGHMNRWNNTMDAYSTARNVPITRLEPKWKRSTNGSLGPDSCIFSNLATTNGDTHSSHVPTLSVQSYSDAASTRPWRGGRRQLPPNDRTVRQSLPGPLPGASVTSYYCTDTDCRKFFSKKSEWKRHEAEVHFAPVFWVCNLNRIIGPSVSRYFVSGSTPACQHTDSGCQKCPASGRKFARKREIKRHLTKWHDMTKQGAGRYVEDEMNYKDMSYQELFCFVCRETCHDWDSRARHIAEHFEDGVTKAKWEAGREAYHAATA